MVDFGEVIDKSGMNGSQYRIRRVLASWRCQADRHVNRRYHATRRGRRGYGVLALPSQTLPHYQKTSEEKPENRGEHRLSDFEFKFDFPRTPDREKVSVVDEAMRVCKVNDVANKRTFTSVMLTKNPADCLEEIMTFESEIRQGEHAKAKNLPALLTARLKALR